MEVENGFGFGFFCRLEYTIYSFLTRQYVSKHMNQKFFAWSSLHPNQVSFLLIKIVINDTSLKRITELIHANCNLKIWYKKMYMLFNFFAKRNQHDEYNICIIYRGSLEVPNFSYFA